MSEFNVDVHTEIPRDQFKVLYAIAQSHNSTVGALVAELVKRHLPVPTAVPVRRGGPSADQIKVLRELHGLHRSDQDIADALGVGSKSTVRRWRLALGLPRVRRAL